MRLTPVKDFLLYIEDCHQALADLYQRLSAEATDHKVTLLLKYMQNQEQLSYKNLNNFVQEASPILLDTWLDNNFDQSFPLRCKGLKLNPELAIKDVVTLSTKLGIQLIELMQTAAFDSHTIEAEIALEHLTDKEEEMLQQAVIVSHEFEYM